MTKIRNNLQQLREQIASCEKKYGREKDSVKLLAVSKNQSIEKISQALSTGQFAFGENYLQEALPKIDFFTEKNIEWHFIGAIQNNKTKKIAENFAWVHSITQLKTAQRLHEQRPQHLPPLNICIEVNISNETTKSGLEFEDVFSLAKECLSLSHLKLRGLMAIPAPENNFNLQRKAFHKLADLYHALRKEGLWLDTLSMGMSQDWEAAIAEGSTMLRIGTAIFGQRN